MRVLLTRAISDIKDSMNKLSSLGHIPIAEPLFKIKPRPFSLPDKKFTALIVTSAHAFDFISDEFFVRIKDLPFYCVGSRSSDIIVRHLPHAHIICAHTSSELLSLIKKDLNRHEFLYLCGYIRKKDIEHQLQPHITALETYYSEAVDTLSTQCVELIKKQKIECILHYSQRSAETFVRLAEKAGLTSHLSYIHHIAISENAAQPLKSFPTSIARQPTEQCLFEMLQSLRPL